jgi:hypothetical protein
VKNQFSPQDLTAFWSLPLAPVALLAEVLGTSPQGVGRLGFDTYRIGSSMFVKLVEVAHGLRGLKGRRS